MYLVGLSKLQDGAYNEALNQVRDVVDQLNKVGETMANITSTDGGGDTVISSISASLHSSVVLFLPVVQGIGIGICVIFFLISMVELVSSDRFSLNALVKELAKLVITVIVIFQIETITDLIYQFGNAFTDLVAQNNFGMDPGGDANTEWLNDLGAALREQHWLTVQIQAVVMMAPMKLVGAAMTAATYIVCFSRLLELNIRLAFMPVACGFIAEDGWKGTAGRYIKKYLSLCCQGAVICMIGKITQAAMGMSLTESMKATSSIGDVFGCVVVSVGVGLACIKILYSSINLTNDLFGV